MGFFPPLGGVERVAPMRSRGARELAARRSARVSALLIGVAGFLLGFEAVVTNGPQIVSLAPWWSMIAVPFVIVVPVVLAVTAHRYSIVRSRLIAAVYAAGTLAIWASWPVAVGPGGLPDGTFPWPSDVLPVAVGAAAYTLPLWSALGYVLILAGARAVVRVDSSGGGVPGSIAAQDAFFTVAFGMFVVLAVLVVRRGAARLDKAAGEARVAASTEARARAQSAARARLDALVHDSVMAILIVAARGADQPQLREPLARQAQLGLVELDSLSRRDETLESQSSSALVDKIRTLVTEISPGASIVVRKWRPLLVPDAACRALVDATAEAVRNSVCHAGDPDRRVERTVAITVSETGVEVEIRDDGDGFEAQAIPTTRLGIARSIVGRMSGLSGGRAEINSAPGQGTSVRLTWQQEWPAPNSFRGGATVAWFGKLETWTVAILFVALHSVLAVANSDAIAAMWPSLVSLGLIASCVVVFCVSWSRRISIGITGYVVGATVVSALVMFWYLPRTGWPGYAAWPLGAGTLLLCAVAVGGRIAWAWVGFGGLVVVTGVWAAPVGAGVVVGLLAPEALTLLVATLVGVVLARTIAEVNRHHRELALSTAGQAASESRQQEIDRRLADLDRLARPMLARIARSELLKPADRQECLLIEAQLRDSIRGRALSTGPVPGRVWLARRRGVDVTLIDDGGLVNQPEHVIRRATEVIATAADSVERGRVVARAQPPGRDSLLTVLVETPESHKVVQMDAEDCRVVVTSSSANPV